MSEQRLGWYWREMEDLNRTLTTITANIIGRCNYHSQCDKLNNKNSQESMENAKRTYEILNSGDRAFKLLERGAFIRSILWFQSTFLKNSEIWNLELHDELPALHDSRILFLVTNMQVMSTFFLTTSFQDNFCLLTIFILSICFPLLYLDNIVIDELADSLCRGGGVPLRDSQGERSLWFWIRFECWAVDQQTSDQKSLPLLLYFGKRNPWVRWSFEGVAPNLLSMTCKSITSHFTGQQ